jgi:hypothetical protein
MTFERGEIAPTNRLAFSLQNPKSLIKLTSKTLVVPPRAPSSWFSRALCRNRRTSQLELAPRTLVKRIRDASDGRARYGSNRGGMRDDIFENVVRI